MQNEDLQAVRELAFSLRELHRALVERARADYESERGPVAIGGGLLHLLTTDEHFAWLRPLSELMVDIDMLLDDSDAAADQDAGVVRGAVEELIAAPANGVSRNDFTPRYVPLIAADPHIAMSHAAVKRVLSRLPAPSALDEAEILHEKHRWALAKRHRKAGT